MDETHFAPLPTAAYGVVLTLAGIAYTWLERALIAYNGPELEAGASGWKRIEGKSIDTALSGGDSAGVCAFVDFDTDLRFDCDDVVYS